MGDAVEVSAEVCQAEAGEEREVQRLKCLQCPQLAHAERRDFEEGLSVTIV